MMGLQNKALMNSHAPFHSTLFFNLNHFFHSSLFEELESVWEALSKISTYLHSCSLGIIEGEISPGAYLIHPELISIGKGSLVEPGAYIKGPCVIGKDCVVRHGAYIRGNLLAGDRCVIGHDTEVKNAIFLDNAHASHFAYVGDSILGNDINLGAGTICANLKLDKSEVSVYHDQEYLLTGLRKFGAVIGDGSQIGCNTVLNPGTLLGKKVFCHPSLNLKGVIPENSVVKGNLSFTIHKRREKP